MYHKVLLIGLLWRHLKSVPLTLWNTLWIDAGTWNVSFRLGSRSVVMDFFLISKSLINSSSSSLWFLKAKEGKAF